LLAVDRIAAVDVGGDILAHGDEPTLRSLSLTSSSSPQVLI
jgi:hypothetical protein